MMNMSLTSGRTGLSRQASAADVRQELSCMDEREADSFLILADMSKENEFIQASGGPHAFIVEYRDDATNTQFQSANTLSYELTERLFFAFHKGDAIYRTMVEWKDISTELDRAEGEQRSQTLTIIVVIVLILVGTAFAVAEFLMN